MRAWNWDRIAAATGIGTVALFIVGFLVVGDRPKIDDPVAEIAAYYGDDRGKLVTAAILFGLGGVLFVWFVSALAAMLYAYGQQRLAATAFGGGVLVVGVLLFILIANAGAMLFAGEGGDEGVLQAVHHLEWASEVVIAWPVAVLAGATAAAAYRGGVFPQWYAAASGVAAVVFLLNGTTWAKDGFWAPDGAWGMISFAVFLAWTIVTSVLLVRRVPAAELPRAATATT